MHLDDLEGKVISLTIQDDEVNHDLISPKFVDLHGKVFVTGIAPKGQTNSGWTDDCSVGVAWDRVTDYIVFDSIESYIYAVKRSDSLDPDEED